eukprot:TRINITY_DN7005_c0_g4_i1.p1 TRINITY_DN7005_c0_g4~~TRINITY_DN7005_c0_g4_i1.p1  ORF type:complete len:161 (+),score=43.63 TRINITY_DN7005_c0_g4_i1:585-1067(+)
MMLFKIFGSRWSRIATEFPGLSENDIKNKFYSSLKSIANKLQDKHSPLRRKRDLVQFVDIAIIHQELLPCKIKRKSKAKRLKRKRPATSASRESEKQLKPGPGDTQLQVWPSSGNAESAALCKALSQMVWDETERWRNVASSGIAKTGECFLRDEIKSHP